MTNQEAFDNMMQHLRSLKGRSLNKDRSSCAYNGTMCAVGALMTDEEQQKFGDHDESVVGLLDLMADEGHKSTLHTLDLSLLSHMQSLHDNIYNWGYEGFIAEGAAEAIASDFQLTYTSP